MTARVPVSKNPRGQEVIQASAWTLGILLIIVFLRLWGRYRYRNLGTTNQFRTRWGDHTFWVLASDAFILLSTIVACVLTAVAVVAVYEGLGLHQKTLTLKAKYKTLEMFFLYQVFYKLGAGISKIATCFLLLAISTPQMVHFNRVCYGMIIYIAGYSLSCSIATVFQCGLDFKSNWIHTNSQKHCFVLPPFWYTHAGLNIAATIIIAALPWWLFNSITYKRKHVVASLMTILSLCELVFESVRLRGLYISAHSLSDLTYGSVTGLVVSALEVNFGIIAACIPTVWKLSEEMFSKFFTAITGRPLHSSQNKSQNQNSSVQLSTMDNNKLQRAMKDYSRFGDDEEDLESAHSGNSRVNIVGSKTRRESKSDIMVETTFKVEVEEDTKGKRGNTFRTVVAEGH